MKYQVFIEGETVDLVVPSKHAVEKTEWYNWFNDAKFTKYLIHHGLFPNTINNQKLVGTNVDFELIENLDFPKFIEIEKDTFNDKVISLDTTKKISFSKEQVDLGIKFEETTFEKKILFPEEPIPIKSSQFSDLNITSKIIEKI